MKNVIFINAIMRPCYFYMFIANLYLFTHSTMLHAAEMSDSTKTILEEIIKTYNTMEYPYQGKGLAKVKIDNFDGSMEVIADFKFKGDMTRTDHYDLDNNGKGEFRCCWALGDKNSFGYNGYNAVIQPEPANQFYRTIGYDYHPRSSFCFLESPLEKILGSFMSGPATISTNLDDKNILHIFIEYKDPNTHEHGFISLDTTKEFRPVYWEFQFGNPDTPERNTKKVFSATWKKYKTYWFVKKCKYEFHTRRIENKQNRTDFIPFVYQAEYEVLEFQPNINIDDSEFTFTGLNLPVGTLIVDQILGITYKHGQTKLDKNALMDGLKKSNIYKADLPENTTGEKLVDNDHLKDTDVNVTDASSGSPFIRYILYGIAIIVIIAGIIFIIDIFGLKKTGKMNASKK